MLPSLPFDDVIAAGRAPNALLWPGLGRRLVNTFANLGDGPVIVCWLDIDDKTLSIRGQS
jgi:hypothetical protein